MTALTGVRTAPDLILGGDAQGVWAFRAQGPECKPEGRIENLTGSIATLFDRGDGWVWGATTDGRVWRADFRGGLPQSAEGRVAPRIVTYGPAEGVPVPGRATCGAWLLRHDVAGDRFVPETRIGGLASPQSRGAEAVGAGADGTWWLRLGAPERQILQVKRDGPERWRTEELAAPMIRDLAVVSMYEDRRTLWVAGKDLLVSVDLDWHPATPPPALAARVRRVVSDAGRAIWRDTKNRPGEPLFLAVAENSVRFEFAAATFAADHRGRPTVQYRTPLAGFDRGWSGWSSEPWRDFTRLPAGRYVFRCRRRIRRGAPGGARVGRGRVMRAWRG